MLCYLWVKSGSRVCAPVLAVLWSASEQLVLVLRLQSDYLFKPDSMSNRPVLKHRYHGQWRFNHV